MTTTAMSPDELKNQLSQFFGTEQYFRHSLVRNAIYTEGVKYLAEKAQCYWLIDEIAICLRDLSKQYGMISIKFESANSKGMITVTDGNDDVLRTKKITYTNFPLPEITLWMSWDGEHHVILLPSEY